MEKFIQYLESMDLKCLRSKEEKAGFYATVSSKPKSNNFSLVQRHMKYRKHWNVFLSSNDIYNKKITNGFF